MPNVTRSIPYTKAHGCGNDFLIVPAEALAKSGADPMGLAIAICDRHYGVGADGLYVLSAGDDEADAEIHLFNSDGSRAELSGNGTRCAAAVLVDEARAAQSGAALRIRTGAGVKELRLLERAGLHYRFEMRIGPARVSDGPDGSLDIWLGNPQCAFLVADFDFDWRAKGRTFEQHAHFPNGTNVDFVRPVDEHNVEARFWERGAGHTLASGTGSAASAVAAIHNGKARSPVSVLTEGGVLQVAWEPGSDVTLTGWAQILARGEFYFTSLVSEKVGLPGLPNLRGPLAL